LERKGKAMFDPSKSKARWAIRTWIGFHQPDRFKGSRTDCKRRHDLDPFGLSGSLAIGMQMGERGILCPKKVKRLLVAPFCLCFL
jgi:hypothetical protein